MRYYYKFKGTISISEKNEEDALEKASMILEELDKPKGVSIDITSIDFDFCDSGEPKE